ncbi:hypothetical protein [Fulvivirga sp.]|uniref:hypothetical protein n=1 Tax=Fulvivirga sp. TaxID=1931237 RepID=UPI0032ECB671
MKNAYCLVFLLAINIKIVAQTQIQSSNIWHSGHRTVIGNSGNFLEPYSGYNSQNNESIQLFGLSNNHGIPVFSFVKSYHGHDYGGSITWISDSFLTTDKRFAEISANVSNGEGSLNFYTRSETDPHGQFNVMTMDKNGNIGLGTTNPSHKLDVKGGSTYLSNYVSIYDFDGGALASSMISRDGNTMFWNGGVVVGRYTDNIVGSLDPGNLVVKNSVGIRTTSPAHKLDVNGTIHAREVLVDLEFDGPDYVFEEDYPLSSLSEIESYIKANKHLPEVPSAAQMKEDGVNVIEMQMLLLKKVEELTLHLIQQKVKNKELEEKVNNLEAIIKK